jgi:hypothetical protein
VYKSNKKREKKEKAGYNKIALDNMSSRFGRFGGLDLSALRRRRDGRGRSSSDSSKKDGKGSSSPLGDFIAMVLFLLVVVGIFVGVYLTWQWLLNGRTFILSGSSSATITSKPYDSTLQMSQPMSFSFWIYINNWDYMRTVPKTVIKKGNVSFVLNANENTLTVSLPSMPTGSSIQLTTPSIPLRKWVHVVFVMSNTPEPVGDLWLNGQLTSSRPLIGLAITSSDESAALYITPAGGFQGSVASVLFFDRSVSREYVHRLYNEGPISSGSN